MKRRSIQQLFRPFPGRHILVAACFAVLAFFPASVRADVGLIVETPTGMLGFLSNVGHVSVWISHGCLDAAGHIQFCDNSAGLVLTSTAYWPNPGAAAIPAELFFLGTQLGPTGRDSAAWSATLGTQYAEVQPAVGAKYLGRAWLRSLRVLKFETSADEDRRVLAELDAVQRDYRYSYSRRNCAFYAQAVLQHYFGSGFHGNRFLELGIDTPRAVERALKHRLEQQRIPFQVIHFPGKLRHAWRQPSRNICESAILDPKYAVPLLIYQPYLYAGFAGCYAAIRISTRVHAHASTLSPVGQTLLTSSPKQEPRLQAFHLLTGSSAYSPSSVAASLEPMERKSSGEETGESTSEIANRE